MKFIKSLLSKKATSFARQKNVVDTFWLVTILMMLLAIVASAISINASRDFFRDFLPVAFPELAGNYTAASIVVSVLLEFITIMLLYLTFYLLLRKQVVIFLFMLLITGSFYFINFHTATTGLEEKTIQARDNQAAIEKRLSRDSSRIYNYYNNIIDSLQTANAQLGGYNTRYNREMWNQNAAWIESYRQERDQKWQAAKVKKKEQIQKNQEEVHSSLWKNSTVIRTNQIAQAVINFLVVLFYFAAHRDQQTVEDRVKEQLDEQGIQQRLTEKAVYTTTETMAHAMNVIANSLQEGQPQGKSQGFPEQIGEGDNGQSDTPHQEANTPNKKIRIRRNPES